MNLGAYTVEFEMDDRLGTPGEALVFHDEFFKALNSISALRSLLGLDGTDEGKRLQNAKNSVEESFNHACLAAYLCSCPEPQAVCSPDGLVHYFNPAAKRLLGYNDVQSSRYKFASLLMPVPPDELALSEDYWDAAARRGTLKARKASGEIFPVQLTKANVRTSEGAFSIVSLHDTSPQQMLKQRIGDLQQELSHLSRYMLLGELATAIAHEVKQPLAAITAYAAAALQPRSISSGLDAKDIRELFGKIAAQAERCSDVIDKLKRLVSDRGIDAVYDDLCATVQEAVHFVSIAAATHNIEITVKMPPHPVILLMDRSQIFVLVSNLVKNAIDELSRWRHERKIEVSLTLPSADTAKLTVADTGPGIHPAAFEKMFDPFHTTKPEGNGMGLALSRRIAEAHSGRLAAMNRPGGGAIFSFVLPVGNDERVGNDDASIIAHYRR